MMKLWLTYLMLLFFLHATSQEPVFRNYTTFDGLPSSETYQPFQDYKGYMWFGTDRGLARFDGNTFKNLTNAEGLHDNSIFGLNEDALHRIWYWPYSSKIGYIYNNKPHYYKYNNLVKDIAGGRLIHNVTSDSSDRVWFGCRKWDRIELISIDKNGKINNYDDFEPGIKNIYLLPNGKCWYSGDAYATTLHVISFETKQRLYTITSSHPEVDYNVFTLRNKQGEIALYTGGEIFILHGNSYSRISDGSQRALSMTFDSDDNLWVGYIDKGLIFYNAKEHYKEYKNFLKTYSITGMLQDKEGGMWFTTLENGVYYLPPSFSLSYSTDNYLPIPKVSKIFNSGGNIEMILSDFTLWVKKTQKSNLEKKEFPFPVYDFDVDSSGRHYYSIGNRNSDNDYDRSGIYVKHQSGVRLGKNCLWSFGDMEIRKHNRNGQVIQQIDFSKTTRITCLFENADSSLLIGTLEGLYLNNDFDSIQKIKRRYLPDVRITDIVRLNEDYLVVGTMGYGVLVLNASDYTVVSQITTKHGLPSNLCHNIIVENNGRVWIGTNKGLCRIDNISDTGKRRLFTIDTYNGIISNEINDMCLSGPDLWIATTKGVSILRRDIELKNVYDIPLYIEHIAVNNKEIKQKQHQQLPFDRNNIRFSLMGINYQYSRQLLYKYRLIGISDKWNTTSNNTIEYNTLPPGNYIFEATTIIPNHGYSSIKVSYPFSISSPFWETWWFRFLVLLLLASIIGMIIHFRVRFIKKQNKIKNDLNVFRDKAMRAQMNPHFIYNSMNSIQNYIRKNDTGSSMSFLSKFSRLMRLTFNNSGSEMVTVAKDIEALQLYVEMQNMRFPGKFSFHIDMDDAINMNRVFIPPFIIQPFVENAIHHGFSLKKEHGNIRLSIGLEEQKLRIEIQDDGIGRDSANIINQKKEKYGIREKRRESGISITISRIEHVWGKKAANARFSITDLFDENNNPAGTLIKFYLPLIYAESNNR